MTAAPQVDPIEFASRDEITALQTKRLQWTLCHAYDNVPRYREKFDAAGVHPDDFKELADLVTEHAPKHTAPFMNMVLGALEGNAGEGGLREDIILLTAKRS